MKSIVIDSFRGDFYFLSNFYESIIYYEGVTYKTAEHAYQAAKTLDPTNKRLIREAKYPSQAKKLGRSVTLRKDWESVKISIMREILREKFKNPFLKELLLATGDSKLIEGNTWGDKFWGVCDYVGENWLGRLLEEIRSEIIVESDKDEQIFNAQTVHTDTTK